MTNHNPHTTARWAALGVLMLPVLLVSIDNTVLAFAVPAIAKALSPSSAEQLWIVDSYSLVLSALLVPMGAIGDRIGRRKLLLIGSPRAPGPPPPRNTASRQSLRSRHSRPPR